MLENMNKVVWAIATALIFSSGIYFTYQLKLIQFSIPKMIKSLFQKTEKGISPIKTLMMTLAGRIGVGSIAGIALAIYIGGVGSIFWMWLVALLSATNAFSETVLGIMYKEKDEGDIYRGGPSYYISKGLGKKTLSKIYAILILISYIGGFISIQANTITKSLQEITPISPTIIGIILCLVTAIIIYGGVKKISDVTAKIVPIMTLIYLIVAFYVVLVNIQIIPTLLSSIFKEAFHLKPFFSSFIPMVLIGIQRGIFSNEAGLGTGSIASSVVNTDDTTSQGFIQMLGIYITTFIICTSTAVIILTSNYQELVLQDINGIEITQYAFQYHLGNFGSILIVISILLFAFSTILTGYYYGESNLKYLIHNIKKPVLILLKLITIVFIFIGSISSSSFLWKIVDILVALLAIINIYALLSLRKQIISEVEYYKHKKV